MTSRELQAAIAAALRAGALNHFEIAADIDQAPFLVRAELRAMKRERLVRERLTQGAIMWELTDSGHRAAAAPSQLRIV